MPDKRDKTTGLPLPSPVDPGSTICVTLQIPDAPEYRQALRGFLADLGKWWTWQHTTGQDDAPAREAAELWREAANTITYSDDCEGTMSCYDVANCIEVNPATRQAINDLLANGPGQTNVYNTSYYGAPMLAAQRNTPVATDPSGECNEDVLFGSVSAIVDQLNTNNTDFLELILLTDNAQQRVSKVIKAIPLLNQVPIDEALDFVSQMTTEIKENYEAQYTSSLRDTYRCDIWCLAQTQPNCEVTFQMLVEYYNNRIGTSLEPINFFGALVQYFISGTWAGSTVVDIMMLIQLSVWQEASNWLGVSLRTLQTVGLLGANDPDHDWAIIPCECSDVWCYRINFEETNGASDGVLLTVTAPGIPEFSGSQWSPGVGLINVDTENRDRTFATLDRDDVMALSVEMTWVYEDTSGSGNVWIDNDFGTAHPTASPETTYTRSYDVPTSLYNLIFGGERAGSDFTPFIIIKSLTIRGEGVNPFGENNCS